MEFVPFVKYHGAGNDFIMIDDRDGRWDQRLTPEWIAHACHRRYGIGADGLILVQPGKEEADFFMKYYNSDGRTSTFCGNGGRCVVAFAKKLGIHNGKCKFLGTDGWHTGEILDNGLVRLSMNDVHEIKSLNGEAITLNTGSPHYVSFQDQVKSLDVYTKGKAIRNSAAFQSEGINVNFVEQLHPGEILIRTYERGVEDETYACGTGVVASAIAASFHSSDEISSWTVHAKGGDLWVDFVRSGPQEFIDVKLTGPAIEVYGGVIEL